MQMRIVGVSLVALGAGLCTPSAAASTGDHPSLCVSYQKEWATRSQGTLPKMIEFLSDPNLKRMCPKTENDAALRIATEQVKEQEQARIRGELNSLLQNASSSRTAMDDARARLAALESSAELDRQARLAAEALADEERRKRLELEAAAAIPGRSRTLIACSISQDVEKMDAGNIPNVKFENIVLPPEVQVVYDIADVGEKAIDVYGWDRKSQQWHRTRSGAQIKGKVITIGSTSQNEANLKTIQRFDLNLDAMIVRGRAMAEAADLGQGSLLNLDLNRGTAGFNLGALTQRGPKLWIEARGNCAYQNGDPPGPLTATPEFRITSREIPKIPD